MLQVKNISATIGDFHLHDISFDVNENDYLTILGLSGAGKTVLLELLAGLIKSSRGSIVYKGDDISGVSIQKRPFGLVYQDMALFPHLTVEQNIMYPLKSKGRTVSAKEKVEELAVLTRTPHLLKRYPGTLSGGEAQRVALARILASDPEILLLDEPLASLDVKLRQELRDLLKEINSKGKTIIHVTHDYLEAATLSKRLAVIENGKLLQTGTPDEVFRNPVSEFVARFSGIKNIFACTFNSYLQANGVFNLNTPKGATISITTQPQKEFTWLMIPGEDIIISDNKLNTSAINEYQGLIKEIYSLNHGLEVMVEAIEDFSVIITRKSAEKLALAPGKKVWITFKASSVKVL